jgi:hypothetical protein
MSAHLERLGAGPRPAGSAAAADARRYCADVLQRAGFAISEHSFEYSAFPAAAAMPIAGVTASLGAIALYLARRLPTLMIGPIVAVLVMFIALSIIGRRGVLGFPFMRRRGTNLEATRGGDTAIWLVAHIDSKWQPVSMIARVIGVVGTSIGLIAMVALAAFPTATSDRVAGVVLMLTWLASVPLMLSIVGHKNSGTLDNASGVCAVLEAAETISRDTRVGVLITDAEELALAGARAWSRTRTPGVALNCDSIDDIGEMTVMYSGSPPHAVIGGMRAAAAAQKTELRVMRLIPGILTDSVALADAGWQAVTLSRGDLRTLQRIHTYASEDSHQARQLGGNAWDGHCRRGSNSVAHRNGAWLTWPSFFSLPRSRSVS